MYFLIYPVFVWPNHFEKTVRSWQLPEAGSEKLYIYKDFKNLSEIIWKKK